MLSNTGGVIRATRKLRILTLASSIIIASSLFTYSISLTILLISLGASLLMIPILSYRILLVRIPGLNDLRIERIVVGPCVEYYPLRIRIEVDNLSRNNLSPIIVEDFPPKLFRKLAEPKAIMDLDSKSKGFFEYEVTPFVGSHSFNKIKITLLDPLLLYEYSRELNIVTIVNVKPLVSQVALRKIRRSMLLTYGIGRPFSKGAGQEFEDVREYMSGDDFSRIEWKSTARTGKFMVKEFRVESKMKVIFYLDATSTMLEGFRGKTKLEVSARIIATVSRVLLGRGDVGLIVFDGRSKPLTLRVSGGRAHFYSILEFLSKINPKPSHKREVFRRFVENTPRISRARSVIGVIVSDLQGVDVEDLDDLSKYTSLLLGRGMKLFLAIPYTPWFELCILEEPLRTIYVANMISLNKLKLNIATHFKKKSVEVLWIRPEELGNNLLRAIENVRQITPLL